MHPKMAARRRGSAATGSFFQYRPSIWAALTEYMPRDMVKRLDDVIRNERGGHFQRRPGA